MDNSKSMFFDDKVCPISGQISCIGCPNLDDCYEDRAVDTNVTDVTTRKRRIKFIEKFPKISRMY